MAKIVTLKSPSDEDIYPVTDASGIRTTGGGSLQNVIDTLIDKFHPVGSIYMSATLSTPAQVAAAFGGTWVAWGTGKVPVGVDTSDTDFDTAEETGGSKSHSHPLGNSGAAGIRNISGTTYCVAGATGVNGLSHMDGPSNSVYAWNHNNDTSTTTNQAGVRLYGNTETKTTMPPYITCYMYKRTA